MKNEDISSYYVTTVGENIVSALKMKNIFFSNIAMAILDFSLLLSILLLLFLFAIAKVVSLKGKSEK